MSHLLAEEASLAHGCCERVGIERPQVRRFIKLFVLDHLRQLGHILMSVRLAAEARNQSFLPTVFSELAYQEDSSA